jgi:hypothetical protein
MFKKKTHTIENELKKTNQLPEKEEKKKADIYGGKSFHLTYKDLPLDFTLDDLYKELAKKVTLEKYAMGSDVIEGHSHAHVYFEFFKRKTFRAEVFNLNVENVIILPFKQKMNNRTNDDKQGIIEYVLGHEKIKTNFEITSDKKLVTMESKLLDIAKQEGIVNALNYYVEKTDKKTAFHKLGDIEKKLEVFQRLDRLNDKGAQPCFDYDTFQYPKEIFDWFYFERDQKTLFLVGNSGIGKTEGMVTFCNKHDLNPVLLINDVNDLKNVTKETKTVIFDDMNTGHLIREELIHLLDKARSHAIRCLYTTIMLDQSVNKIFIANNDQALKEKQLTINSYEEALVRRCFVLKVGKNKFFKENQQQPLQTIKEVPEKKMSVIDEILAKQKLTRQLESSIQSVPPDNSEDNTDDLDVDSYQFRNA